jgi:hypothetical protein
MPSFEGVRQAVPVGVDGHRAGGRGEGDPNGQDDDRQ